MKEIFDTTLPVPESMVEGPRRIEPGPEDFSGARIFTRPEDIDELYGRTLAEKVGDKLFYGAVGATVLTLAAGVAAGKKIVSRR